MCEMLGVSRSGYYKHLEIKARPDKNAILLAEIRKILEEDTENENYGKVRMYDALRGKNIKCSQPRVSQIMDENGLRVSKKRKPNGESVAQLDRACAF